MGDDLPDLCIMEKVGLPACPADAVEEILDVAKFVSTKGGGKGAVREFANFILKSKGVDIKQQGRGPACST
jgi:3-deoxy-D-manno-octulosonate 8-phosphate phosphatase (KDO 8-P phosphatase)